MVKAKKQHKKLFDSSEDDQSDNDEVPKLIPVDNRIDDDDDENEGSRSYDEVDSDLEIAQQDDAAMEESEEEGDFEMAKIKQFAQRGINEEAKMLQRVQEIRANFYNRLESKKLIKKQGRVPFTEHMTISKR